MKKTFKHAIILTTLLILTSLFLFNCEDSNPIKIEEIPGRRDYVWRIDTLRKYDPFYRLWGSSPKNIFVTGAGPFDKKVIHYNGENWSYNTSLGIVSIYSIGGFSENETFLGGSKGRILKLNGTDWEVIENFESDGSNEIGINQIWGFNENNFYAAGACRDATEYYNKTVVFNYKNSRWNQLNMNGARGIVESICKESTSSPLYFNTIYWGGGVSTDSTFLYEYSDSKTSRIYSGEDDYDEGSTISMIGNKIFFSIGEKLFIRKNKKFVEVLNLENENYYNKFWGKNGKDIFLKMTDGLAHYNGTDVEYLFSFDKPKTHVFDALLFEDEVFFLVYEDATTMSFIYHGKLL
ncbi:MAG: hypothetical protein JEY94_19275 [Melioribacteraceae bacterium]|nr:hypothetical protein [Melioribacteraceae bacterium]